MTKQYRPRPATLTGAELDTPEGEKAWTELADYIFGFTHIEPPYTAFNIAPQRLRAFAQRNCHRLGLEFVSVENRDKVKMWRAGQSERVAVAPSTSTPTPPKAERFNTLTPGLQKFAEGVKFADPKASPIVPPPKLNQDAESVRVRAGQSPGMAKFAAGIKLPKK